MTGAGSKQLFRPETPFFLLALMTWGTFFVLNPHAVESTPFELLFTFWASLFSFAILKLLGYFDVVRLYPRKSDIFLVLVAMPVGGIAAHGFIQIAFHLSVCPPRTMLVWSPFLALIVFGGHHLLASVFVHARGRKKIVLDLLPHERSLVLSDFASMGMFRHLQFLDRRDLLQYLERGEEEQIALIVISRGTAGKFNEDKTLLRAHLAGVPITDHTKISSALTGRIRLTQTDLWSFVLSATPQTWALKLYSRFKMIVEPAIAVMLALLTAPLMIALAVLVKCTSRGPVLYRQVRTGYLDRPFLLYKFRSMYTDAESGGPQWSSAGDVRVTPLGRIMRRTRLDELPQLLNVLRGEMGFFGPRPERPEISEQLKQEIPIFSLRTVIRPGITGWAQVCAGYAASVTESRSKLEYDLFYIQHMSPRLDLIILIKTVKVALFGSRVPHLHLEEESFMPAVSKMSQR